MKVEFNIRGKTCIIDQPKLVWFWIGYEAMVYAMEDWCIKLSPWILYLYCTVLHDLIKQGIK